MSTAALSHRYLSIPCAQPREKGYTFDTAANVMLRQHHAETMRYDRIMVRTGPGGRTARVVELLGTSPLPGLPNVTLSDHFGLVARLE